MAIPDSLQAWREYLADEPHTPSPRTARELETMTPAHNQRNFTCAVTFDNFAQFRLVIGA